MRRIGIDVGGTNTDAVLIAGSNVVRAVKTATTADVTGGILAALKALSRFPEVTGQPIDAVMIGTTHFINAVVQGRSLNRVGALRIGLPAGATLPPFCDWPPALADLVRGEVAMVEGGHDYDGRPFMPLDRAAVTAAAHRFAAAGLKAVAIASVFSPIDPSCETEAAEIVRTIIPDAAITCSHELGRIGLLERENAALMNAALAELARETVAAFEAAIAESGLKAPLYITQNDGTVMLAAHAMRQPVLSFASGATNSMRGAAFLSGIADAMVIDVGGTTTDIGQLRHGFPREANGVVEVGGVRTLFRMPDLLSIGLGGGSHVEADGDVVGPLSVGHRLTTEALVFGGSRLTTSDVAVAAGMLELGDRARVAHLDPALIGRMLARAHAMVEENVDRMKTDSAPLPLIAVGGGAFLVPDAVAGTSQVVRVTHGDCANAVGAAIAQVSGEIDQVFQGMGRTEAVAAATGLAQDRAVAAGADAATLQTIEVEDIPLAYLPGNALRVRVRVVGDIGAAG
ncbi:hydantoinase/oxoprolinase-like protein [Stella humosa]|uniref:Hydantoinase/oxoprolinase-like protein n=1 Tax=Stella humosa TaxID=94 RepID=A0A3N1LHJ9_9PROT|nr:hydantoinase/oxoprolinase family protein [Stella humosa]ROP90704.1 hydantoinase/oxoprolinase-like protein [Stella humosa]